MGLDFFIFLCYESESQPIVPFFLFCSTGLGTRHYHAKAFLSLHLGISLFPYSNDRLSIYTLIHPSSAEALMWAEVQYAYTPDAEHAAEELVLAVGDRIKITSQDDPGWWQGVLKGRTGLFPSMIPRPQHTKHICVSTSS